MSNGKQYLLSFTTFFNSGKGYMLTFNLHERVNHTDEYPLEYLPWNRHEAIILSDIKEGVKVRKGVGILHPSVIQADMADVEVNPPDQFLNVSLADYLVKVHHHLQRAESNQLAEVHRHVSSENVREVFEAEDDSVVADFYGKLSEVLADINAEIVLNVFKDNGTVVTVYRDGVEDKSVKVLRYEPIYDGDQVAYLDVNTTLDGITNRFFMSSRIEKIFETHGHKFDFFFTVLEADKEELEDSEKVFLAVEEKPDTSIQLINVEDAITDKMEFPIRPIPEVDVRKFNPSKRIEDFDVDFIKESPVKRLMQIMYGDKALDHITTNFRLLGDLVHGMESRSVGDREAEELKGENSSRVIGEGGASHEFVEGDVPVITDTRVFEVNRGSSVLSDNIVIHDYAESDNVQQDRIVVNELGAVADNVQQDRIVLNESSTKAISRQDSVFASIDKNLSNFDVVYDVRDESNATALADTVSSSNHRVSILDKGSIVSFGDLSSQEMEKGQMSVEFDSGDFEVNKASTVVREERVEVLVLDEGDYITALEEEDSEGKLRESDNVTTFDSVRGDIDEGLRQDLAYHNEDNEINTASIEEATRFVQALDTIVSRVQKKEEEAYDGTGDLARYRVSEVEGSVDRGFVTDKELTIDYGANKDVHSSNRLIKEFEAEDMSSIRVDHHLIVLDGLLERKEIVSYYPHFEYGVLADLNDTLLRKVIEEGSFEDLEISFFKDKEFDVYDHTPLNVVVKVGEEESQLDELPVGHISEKGFVAALDQDPTKANLEMAVLYSSEPHEVDVAAIVVPNHDTYEFSLDSSYNETKMLDTTVESKPEKVEELILTPDGIRDQIVKGQDRLLIFESELESPLIVDRHLIVLDGTIERREKASYYPRFEYGVLVGLNKSLLKDIVEEGSLEDSETFFIRDKEFDSYSHVHFSTVVKEGVGESSLDEINVSEVKDNSFVAKLDDDVIKTNIDRILYSQEPHEIGLSDLVIPNHDVYEFSLDSSYNEVEVFDTTLESKLDEAQELVPSFEGIQDSLVKSQDNLLTFESALELIEDGWFTVETLDALDHEVDAANDSPNVQDAQVSVDETSARSPRVRKVSWDEDVQGEQKVSPKNVVISEEEQSLNVVKPKNVVISVDDKSKVLSSVYKVDIEDDINASYIDHYLPIVVDDESSSVKVPKVRNINVTYEDLGNVERKRKITFPDEDVIGRGQLPSEPPWAEPKRARNAWLIIGKQYPAWNGWNPKKTR